MAVINKFDEGWKNKDKSIVDSVLSELEAISNDIVTQAEGDEIFKKR